MDEQMQMTGTDRLLAAFSDAGSAQVPAVLCYEGIYIRDRWRELSQRPWWYRVTADLPRQLAWRHEVIRALGQDWFRLPIGSSHQDQANLWIDERGDQVFQVDDRHDTEVELIEPPVGGWSKTGELQSVVRTQMPASHADVDRAIDIPATWHDPKADGRADLPRAVLDTWGGRLLPTWSISSPFWGCYDLWGFEGLMTRAAEEPALVTYACERHAQLGLHVLRDAMACGARAIWIEECFTDLLSPAAFRRLHLPSLQRLVDAIRDAGLLSIYYYCGDPSGKWDDLLAAGADALALEESKKGFTIDIEDVVRQVGGRCTIFGNLDAVGILQDGTDEQLRSEIARQIDAGRRNQGRFVMSLGSPVTPNTPVARVRQYCDLVHELGS